MIGGNLRWADVILQDVLDSGKPFPKPTDGVCVFIRDSGKTFILVACGSCWMFVNPFNPRDNKYKCQQYEEAINTAMQSTTGVYVVAEQWQMNEIIERTP